MAEERVQQKDAVGGSQTFVNQNETGGDLVWRMTHAAIYQHITQPPGAANQTEGEGGKVPLLLAGIEAELIRPTKLDQDVSFLGFM
jgi:hypothetical protein